MRDRYGQFLSAGGIDELRGTVATGHRVARDARGAVLLNVSRIDDVRIDAAARMRGVEGGDNMFRMNHNIKPAP